MSIKEQGKVEVVEFPSWWEALKAIFPNAISTEHSYMPSCVCPKCKGGEDK